MVIHEIFGRQPEIDRVVERFAGAGYAAVAPDLFARGRFRCLREVFGAIRSGHGGDVAIQQGRNARAWLCEQTGLGPEHVGLIGFCFGGGYVLMAGAGWAAVSTNYGPVPKTAAMQGLGPVIACYGSRDRPLRSAPRQLEQRLAELGHEPPEVHTFDAGHSFLTDGTSRWLKLLFGDHRQAREQAWPKIFAFFDRRLTSAT